MTQQQVLYLDSLPFHAYQNLNFAVFMKNLNSSYLWGNAFFINRSAGYHSLTDIYNKQDHHFAWYQYADTLRKNDQILFDSAQSFSAYEQILRHDGLIVNILSKKSPVFDQKHKLIGLIGFSIELPQSNNLPLLTRQECKIVFLLSEGYTYKQIAKKLGVSPRTVETHINHAKQKLQVRSRGELIAQFLRKHP